MLFLGNNIDVIQSIVCHVERSEPLGRWKQWHSRKEKAFMDNIYIIAKTIATTQTID